MNVDEINIRKANNFDMAFIESAMERFELYYDHLKAEEFSVAELNDELLGFVRVLEFNDVHELSALGVDENFRNKGIGKKLLNYLLEEYPTHEIYIATTMEKFFEKFGFTRVEAAPKVILEKYTKLKKTDKNPCMMILKQG